MFKKIKKIEQALEISEGIIDDITKVSCLGNEKVIIENYLGILEYEDYMIRINTGSGDIFIYGTNLVINELSKDDILINGKIHNIEFED